MNRKKQHISINPRVMQSLLNEIPIPVLWISEQDGVLGINESAQKLWNIKEKQLLSQKLSYTLTPSQSEENMLHSALIHIKEKEYQGFIVKTEPVASSDNQHWDAVSRYLLTPSTQNAYSNELMHQDIYHYMENIIAEIPISVYWMNTEYIYLGCSNDMAKLLRLKSRHDIVGKTYKDLYDEQSGTHYKKADQEVIQKGVSLSLEEPLYQPDGTKEVYLSKKVPLKNTQGIIIGMLGISVNITERIKMEQALENAKKQAEAANAAKTEFIANMSHDIRTPLTGVIGFSEILENTLQNSEQKEDAHMLHDSGEELLHMLNDILDDVRAEHMSESDVHKESFDLYQCIQDLARLELPTIKLKHLDLRIDIDSKVPQYIVNDRKKIHRILLNLLGNAIKFTQSGCITIAVKCLDIKTSRVHLQFEVADTGIGIPKDLQAKVFDRFFRVTSSYKGLYTGHGLGLHIAQSYVSLLGGHITLTSEEGVGSTFHFDLSCKIGNNNKNASSTPSLISDKNEHTIPQSSIDASSAPHLLLVEDNTIALKVLESTILQTGCQFKSAVTGEEALKLAKTMEFDMVITDIGLPGISGNELTHLIRDWEKKQHKSPLPIIGLTGHAQESAKFECTACGMNDVFSKPVNLAMMQKIIKAFAVFQQPEKNILSKDSVHKSGTLGEDLPETENELFELDNYPLFDVNDALQQIGNQALLVDVLKDFVSDAMQNDVVQMEKAYVQQDWSTIEKIAHKIKGGVSYLGTQKLKYACQYLERYYKADHRNLLDKLYHQLMAVNRITLETVKEWLKQNAIK